MIKPPGLIASVRVADGRASIHVQGSRVEGPSEALKYVARTAEVRACDFPGALGDAAKLSLAERLVRAGVLRRA